MEAMPPTSSDSGRRTRALDALGLLDADAEREFVVLTELAKRSFGVGIAMYSLMDAHRQWVKASCGLAITDLPLEQSFCAHVLAADDLLVVEDLAAHPVFASSVFVTGAPHVRFYAGVPLHARALFVGPSPVAIGTLCLLDHRPHRFGDEDRAALKDIARIAEALIDARASAMQAELLAEERRHALRQLQREQRQFRQAERMGNMGSWRVSAQEGITHWSEGVYAIHELPAGELPDIDAALGHYPPEDRVLVEAAVARALDAGEPFDIEIDFVTAKGNRRRVRSLGEPEGNPEAGDHSIIGVFQDVTARHGLEQSLRRVASTDDLTQIPNRAACNRALDEAMRRARAAGSPLALLLIDLDGFKSVNDRCGHLVGDDLLRSVGARLKAPYLSGCFVARLGGDEFVVVASTPEDCGNLDALVEQLLADLRHTVTHGEQTIAVSGTVGIAWLDESVTDRSELMRRADTALYAAKAGGRGAARTYGADSSAQAG
ncbi:diguanylate cyclase domain-containing protein [Antarcticirhabdus aurantiaca]|uniref:Diguanylate cyclase n=1 Tax=Antarcticirhabdus aurantiaca TaxID=2606717 RepID=A0ACD4NS42_9HYPH|nr:diguanylate cyclase [Antarcticirhabdus aurantiaca]WAJ29568.1 diguanylate cyclase [Jeongeuplla avenae]